MTNDDLVKDWQQYAIEIEDEGQKHTILLKDRYMLCYGYQKQFGGVCFDEGGPQWAEMHTFDLRNDDEMWSVNPRDHSESCLIGKLVKLT